MRKYVGLKAHEVNPIFEATKLYILFIELKKNQSTFTRNLTFWCHLGILSRTHCYPDNSTLVSRSDFCILFHKKSQLNCCHLITHKRILQRIRKPPPSVQPTYKSTFIVEIKGRLRASETDKGDMLFTVSVFRSVKYMFYSRIRLAKLGH